MHRLTTCITGVGALMVATVALMAAMVASITTWGSEVRAELGRSIAVAQAEAVNGEPEATEATEAAPSETDPLAADQEYLYDPSGRRDPFIPLIQKPEDGGRASLALPPLQRVGLTEINLIGIIWGGFGYTAMVQTPDGKGYSVRRGTRIGPNNGIVSKVTQNSIVVTERYTDIYGKEQEREYVKLLHPSEDSE